MKIRDVHYSVRLNPIEAERLAFLAEVAGISRGAVISRLIVGVSIMPPTDIREQLKIIEAVGNAKSQ